MNFIKYIIIFSVFFTSTYAKEKIEVDFNKYGLEKIGFMEDIVFTTKKESIIGEILWKKEMKSHDINAILKRAGTEKELLDLYEKKEIYSIIDDGFIYYKYKKKFEKLTRYKWILSLNNKKFIQYYLLKNKKIKFSLKKLNNKKIFYKDEIAKIWFEYLLLKRNIKTNKILRDIKKIKKNKNLIFNSFFNENGISIVSKDLYDSMIEINPQIKEKVEIVLKSKPIFFNIIGLTRKDFKGDNLNDNIVLGKNFGSEILSFAKVQKVYILEKEDLYETDKFFEEYYNLKKKINK